MGQKQSALTSQQISDMRCMTHLSQEDILNFHKEFLKDYPKGKLTKADMKKLYKKTYPTGDPEDAVEELFRVYDMDNSGTMDFREFLAGLGVMSKGNDEGKLRLAFEMYDADRSGYISNGELHNLVQAIYKATAYGKYDPKVANTVGEVMFEQLDKNKDNKISLQEFINGAKSDPSIIRMINSTELKKH